MTGIALLGGTRANAQSPVIPMNRMGSGTSWIPDAVALPSIDFAPARWDLMVHGFLSGMYDHQGGRRGADQTISSDWGMLMAGHELGGGRVLLRTMLSLDALGITTRGYPLLLQSGETYRGLPLVDRQHPHDFFMEVGAQYDRTVAPGLGFELYAAASGEPALGPVSFMHRPSAMDDPVAPIGHHWQDASHESFGVATAGFFTRRWKLEGSLFNGRDPDENRWNFDIHPLDSYAGRATFNPDSEWSISAGFGFIKSPEAADAGHSMHRTVLAVQHARVLGDDRRMASTALWTAMAHSDQARLSQSALFESELTLDARNAVFGRAEFVQKTVDDLVVPAGPSGFAAERMFDVGAVSLGYVRELGSARDATLGVGAMGTINVVPSAIESYYGSRTPLGLVLFARVRVAPGSGGAMAGMHMETAP